MFNANENKEKARVLIETYLCNIHNQNFILREKEFGIFLNIALNPKKEKVEAIQFLRELFKGATVDWNICECKNNYFEDFVKDQESKPAQELHYMVGLKEAKDIVEWLVAQKGWFF